MPGCKLCAASFATPLLLRLHVRTDHTAIPTATNPVPPACQQSGIPQRAEAAARANEDANRKAAAAQGCSVEFGSRLRPAGWNSHNWEGPALVQQLLREGFAVIKLPTAAATAHAAIWSSVCEFFEADIETKAVHRYDNGGEGYMVQGNGCHEVLEVKQQYRDRRVRLEPQLGRTTMALYDELQAISLKVVQLLEEYLECSSISRMCDPSHPNCCTCMRLICYHYLALHAGLCSEKEAADSVGLAHVDSTLITIATKASAPGLMVKTRGPHAQHTHTYEMAALTHGCHARL